MSASVAAIVLAAGESSRMGRPKPLLPLNGQTFLGHLLTELRASQVDRIIVVLGHKPEQVLEAMPEVRPLAVVNDRYALGQLSSLILGLETVDEGTDAVLLCLADHPFVTAGLIDELIARYEETRRPIVVPVHAGRRGHPVLFGSRLFEELRAAPLDQGARVVVRAHADEVLEVATDEPGILADVDTPEEYERWRTFFRDRDANS
jgi:molybdenum cofactor cytidylyltransferase